MPSQIVVVDDFSNVPASTALSKVLLERLHTSYGINLLFLRNDHNMGLAASYNSAIKHCINENIVLMHPDIVLPSTFEIAKLVEPLESAKVCLVGHKSVPTSIKYWSDLNVSGKLFVAASESKHAIGFNGQFDAFRKSDAEQINCFNSARFRTAGEDGDFRTRMTTRGEYVVSNAKAEHHHDFRGSMDIKGSLRKAAQYGNAQGALLFHGAKIFSAHREFLAVLFLLLFYFRPVFGLAAFSLILVSILRLPCLIFRRDKNILDFFCAFCIESIRFWAHVYGYTCGLLFRKQKM